nr:hypothetical protein [uncultured Flavobacterium sp.]
MSLLIIFSFVTFLFYYFGCLDCSSSRTKLLFIICFVVCSFLLRGIIDPALNNDFYLYYNFQIFQKPTSFLSFIINEPYLYSVYSFFNIFSTDKGIVFSCLYWFNHIITTFFFAWLLKLKDVETWKKMLLFSIFYFFLAFVLLRNGPVYLLFALYFYFNFRSKKFNYVLITPFMHISAGLMIIVFFHKWKKYYLFFVITCILVPICFLILRPLLQDVSAFQRLLLKINDYYSQSDGTVGIMHWLFFIFISIFLFGGAILYKKQMLHPFLITSAVLYYITYFINPIVAFRFSPYVLFALLFIDFNELKNNKIHRVLNLLSVFLFPFYLFVLFHTHHL